MTEGLDLRRCLRDPIPEIADAARYLDAAVSAHLAGPRRLAEELIRLADMPALAEWAESLWGEGGPHAKSIEVAGAHPSLPKTERAKPRDPDSKMMAALRERDGFNCRFCGIPVIRTEVRQAIKEVYPNVLRWRTGNANKHTAFHAMWLQYDHVLPHSRGGATDLGNLVITCAPCNYGRSERLVEEVGLLDPRLREPVPTTWDGLERFRSTSETRRVIRIAASDRGLGGNR